MELKYKGKRIDNEEWVYGCPIIHSDDTAAIYITKEDKTLFVYKDSLRRFINAFDKYGEELYVGDIVNDFGGGVLIEAEEEFEIDGKIMTRPVWAKEGDDTRNGVIVEEGGTVKVKTEALSYAYNLSDATKFSDMKKTGNTYESTE